MKIVYRKISEEQNKVKNMLIENNFNQIYAHILALRNVKSLEEAKYNYKLIPTNRLKGIDKLSDRLIYHILNNHKISIVADYDCDGATSCAIAYRGLKLLNCKNLDFIVPNRFKHGYGLSEGIINDLIAEKGKPDCIITVDNGIAAHSGVDYANQLNIEVLVTDHHLPIKDKENPNCYALVNPNQVGDTSNLNNLAGCGVIFYVIVETCNKMIEKQLISSEIKQKVFSLLDLVSLGTIADVVKLDSNNRLLVKHGLNYVKKQITSIGLQNLFKIANRNINFATSSDYGFSIAPRINAAGRLEDMTTGIKCLLSNDNQQSVSYANQLNSWNIKRKNIENDMKDTALSIIEDENQQNNLSRVIFNEDYHEGVVGIVAGRLKEKYNVPVIVFSPTEDPNLIKGSGRSIPEIHLRDALDLVSKKDQSIFKAFGGHSMAAGLTIYKDKLDIFKKLFEETIEEIIGKEPITKEIFIDYELKPTEISLELAKNLENEIWGQGFLEPTFSSILKIKSISYLNSKDEDNPKPIHTKFIFEDENQNEIEGISFFNIFEFKENDNVKIIFKIQISRFREENINLLISHCFSVE